MKIMNFVTRGRGERGADKHFRVGNGIGNKGSQRAMLIWHPCQQFEARWR